MTGIVDFAWSGSSDPGGLAPVVYDALRSADASDFLAAVCLESDDGADTTVSEPAMPADGSGFYFLIRAENPCPGGGTLGYRSTGQERSGPGCP